MPEKGSSGRKPGGQHPRDAQRRQGGRSGGQGNRTGGQGARRDGGRGQRKAPAPAGAPDGDGRQQKARPRPRILKASPARIAALDVGTAARLRDAFAHELLEARLDAARLAPEDRAFATRLALGVASAWGTLDEVIDRALSSPDDVQPDVRDALRVSTYEIIFLNKASHAAVDQGVELVRSVAPRAAGLANAVLRKIVAMRDEFPFGDPATDLAAFARLHAFPQWLAELLVADLGAQAARDLMAASNEPAPLFVAVNEARCTQEEAVSLFADVGTAVRPVSVCGREVPGCLQVGDGRALLDGRVRRMLAHGGLLVSDAASQAVASLAVPDRMPGSFLEVGSGRATKTILLQSHALRRFGDQMPLTALDNRAFKADLLRERTDTYGTRVDRVLVADAARLGRVLPGERFDAVFIDAPCSGLGTLRRHPEIRWRLDPATIGKLAEAGLAMLRSAAGCVAPGGSLVYATCTVTHAENNGTVVRFLESAEGAPFQLDPIAGKGCFATRLSPGSPDAHFAVRFVRSA